MTCPRCHEPITTYADAMAVVAPSVRTPEGAAMAQVIHRTCLSPEDIVKSN